jgi:hypothetical protein
MEYKPADIMRLLQEVAEKTGFRLVNSHFPMMHEKMKPDGRKTFFAENYLYKKMFLRARKALKEAEGSVKLNAEYVEIIAKFLDYKNYDQFLEMRYLKFPDEMENCAGVWYSYVRCNSGNLDVYASPVHIYQHTKQIFVEMQGFSRKFKGELKMEGNCLYCLLESGQGKNFHLVLKIGVAKKPNVLQGVFSGLSSGGDPIAGREVWVRQYERFENLKHKKLKISELIHSKNEEEKMIGEYFSDKEKNILKAGQASTFELSDLRNK